MTAASKTTRRQIDMVAADTLTLDQALYPRERINNAHIRELVMALDMEAAMPPIVVWRKTGQVVDGFHRWHAHCQRYSREAPILVEWRDYPSKADAFRDACEMNAVHGLRFRAVDHAYARERARELGLSQEALAAAIKVPIRQLQKRRLTGEQVTKGFARRPPTTPDERESWVEGRDLDVELRRALTDLARRMAPETERGPGQIPEILRAVTAAKAVGGRRLRNALLEAAAAFVWWASRTPGLSDEAVSS